MDYLISQINEGCPSLKICLNIDFFDVNNPSYKFDTLQLQTKDENFKIFGFSDKLKKEIKTKILDSNDVIETTMPYETELHQDTIISTPLNTTLLVKKGEVFFIEQKPKETQIKKEGISAAFLFSVLNFGADGGQAANLGAMVAEIFSFVSALLSLDNSGILIAFS